MDSARRTQILKLEQRRQSASLHERYMALKFSSGPRYLEEPKWEEAFRGAAKEFVAIRRDLGSQEPDLLTEAELTEWLANAKKTFEAYGGDSSATPTSLGAISIFLGPIARADDVLEDGFHDLHLSASLGMGSTGTGARNSKAGVGTALIAESRLNELRALTSSNFDFKKLIRLCEELNIASREECHLATAMLTRSLLEHVPPLFGHTKFSEVANNYGGGGKSFKGAMQHLEGSARKVADAHLHMPIRNSETLPVAQQVEFEAPVDMLLAEIVRIKP